MECTLEATSSSTEARCAFLPSKTGVVYPCDPLTQWQSPPFVKPVPKRAWVSFSTPFRGAVSTVGSGVDINERLRDYNAKTE